MIWRVPFEARFHFVGKIAKELALRVVDDVPGIRHFRLKGHLCFYKIAFCLGQLSQFRFRLKWAFE
jgi:hypothetical protein